MDAGRTTGCAAPGSCGPEGHRNRSVRAGDACKWSWVLPWDARVGGACRGQMARLVYFSRWPRSKTHAACPPRRPGCRAPWRQRGLRDQPNTNAGCTKADDAARDNMLFSAR